MTILQQPVLDMLLRGPTICLLSSVPPRLRGEKGGSVFHPPC